MELFDLETGGDWPTATGPTGASLFDRQPACGQASGRPSIDALVRPLTQHLESVSRDRAMAVLGEVRGHLDAVEARLLADAVGSGASDREVDRLSSNSGGSKRNARKKTKRAKAVNKNPDLAAKLENGDLNDEKVDAIAGAADKTDGAAATDLDLIDEIENAPVDQAADIVRRWLNDRAADNEVETEHQRQRRHRCAKRFTNKDDLDTIMASGDTETIDRLWNLITADADKLYQAEGGRDVAHADHRTTPLQRLFDAFANRIDGPRMSAVAAATVRPTVFVTTGLNPDTGDLDLASLAGGSPLPKSVLERMLCNADLIAAAFDQQGEVLWQGRKVRTATRAQLNALIVRDQGCVLCDAPYARCEAHHLTPYNAPAKGKTNIDEMALVCGSCHHHIHDAKLTLHRADRASPKHGTSPPGTKQPRTTWRTRPATPDETPPPRPPV